MKRKTKRKKSILVRVIVLGVSVYMVATLVNLGNQLAKDRETLKEEQKKLSAIELDVEELKVLLNSDSHSKIIEKAARERLGFVYSDEEIYVDISGN